MTRVEVDKLSAGIKIARDVVDRSGRILLRAGAEISSKHIRILRTWGVSEVVVGSESEASAQADQTPSPNYDPELKARIEAHFESRFQRYGPDDQFASALRKQCVERSLRRAEDEVRA